MDTLINNIDHKNDMIRKQCFKGIRNVSYIYKLESNPKIRQLEADSKNFVILSREKLYQISTVMIKGFDDQSDCCIRECLGSYQKITEITPPAELGSIIPQINQRICVCFEQ